MGNLIAIWAALLFALVIFAIGRPGRGGALTLAYFLGLSLIHVPGVLPFLNPESGLADFDETRLGFELTIIGMAAFVVGAVLAQWIDRRSAAATGALPRRRAQMFDRLGRRTLGLGVVAYFVLRSAVRQGPVADLRRLGNRDIADRRFMARALWRRRWQPIDAVRSRPSPWCRCCPLQPWSPAAFSAMASIGC